MKKVFFVVLLVIISAVGAAAQTKTEAAPAQTLPENFVSDGCTSFPDKDYVDCCVQHDLAYFKGGSWTARWRADGELRKCVAAKQGWWHKPVSILMWSGVRVFGVPFLPTKFRWGFGRDFKPIEKNRQTKIKRKINSRERRKIHKSSVEVFFFVLRAFSRLSPADILFVV